MVNLIKNPGFEQTLGNEWTGIGYAGSIQYFSENYERSNMAFSGQYSLHLLNLNHAGTTSTGGTVVQPKISVLFAVNYLRVRFKLPTAGGLICVYGGSNGVGFRIRGNTILSTDGDLVSHKILSRGWQEIIVKSELLTQTSSLAIVSLDSEAYVDDVWLDTSPPPPPLRPPPPSSNMTLAIIAILIVSGASAAAAGWYLKKRSK